MSAVIEAAGPTLVTAKGCSGGPSQASAQEDERWASIEKRSWESTSPRDGTISRMASAVRGAVSRRGRCLAGEHDPDRAAPGEKYNRVQFCYEAGPTGYGLYRLITALGHDCAVSRHR